MMRREEDTSICRGGILADEMGLGKTWETIGLLLNRPVPTSLILVPPVLVGQWSDALAQAEIPHKMLISKQTWKTVVGKREGIQVLLSTYDRASRNMDTLRLESSDRMLCD